MNIILFDVIDQDTCSKEFNVTGVIFGVFIILAIFLTYIPQYYKIIKKKSSKGISNIYIFLYNVTNFTNFFGTLLINFNLVNCCTHVSGDKCMNLLLPIIQMFTPWISVFVLYIIFIIYEETYINRLKTKSFISFIIFITIFVFFLGFIGMGFLLEYPKYQKNVKIFGDCLNIISTITCVLCLFPQIYQIYKQKNIGNLSLISVALQTPGSLIVFIYQYFIINGPFSIGMPYLFSFIFQTILLIQGIYYDKFYKTPIILINSYDDD